MNRIIAGALGGIVATIPMTVAMVTLFRKLPRAEQYPLPPREITEEIVRRMGHEHRLNERQHAKLALLAHFGYGAATGALHAALVGRTRHPVAQGCSYGVAVWAASYLGWIPAANILRPATEHPRRRLGLMIAVHLIWGAGTVLTSEYLSRPRQ